MRMMGRNKIKRLTVIGNYRVYKLILIERGIIVKDLQNILWKMGIRYL